MLLLCRILGVCIKTLRTETHYLTIFAMVLVRDKMESSPSSMNSSISVGKPRAKRPRKVSEGVE